MLTSGKVNEDVVTMYPELDGLTLPIQLEMFNQTYKPESLHEAKLFIGVWNMQCTHCFPKY